MEQVKFTMILDKETADKMSYIAKYYGRSRIQEIVQICKQHIKDFESNVDEIRLEPK